MPDGMPDVMPNGMLAPIDYTVAVDLQLGILCWKQMFAAAM